MSSVLQESSAHSYNKMISMAKEAADKLVELLFKSYLDSSSKLNILDLGCGPGYLCNSLADRLGDKGDITGVDPDPERIKLAMELYGDKSNVKFAVAGDQDFPEGLYDVIIATSVVHWIKDKDSMFKRICDNLKPGGYFAFTSSDGPFRPDIMVEVIESLGPQVIQDTFGTQFYESADYYRQVAPSYGFEVAFMEVRNPSFNYPNIHSAIDFIYGAFHGRFNRSSPAVKEIIQKYEERQTSFVMTNPRLTVILKKGSHTGKTNEIIATTQRDDTPRIVYVEPFYGGSHKQLVDLLRNHFKGQLYTLPDSKWHWNMRTSALYFTLTLSQEHNYNSVLNLCELTALRPELKEVKKILYFHENQLIYPIRKHKERDFQYGYNQILSCLTADVIIFNSYYNMETFVNNIDPFLKIVPHAKFHGIADRIKPKCQVIYFPLEIPLCHYYSSLNTIDNSTISNCLHIVWPHRWEHDKGPDELCEIIKKLIENDLEFNASILGSHTNDIPECFKELFPLLGKRLLHRGSVEREQYWKVLGEADVVLSTAKHEFYGVAMLEGTCCGCYPLCPNDLVYRELFPGKDGWDCHCFYLRSDECLYNTQQQLFKKLKNLCNKPYLAKHYRNKMCFDPDQFQWTQLQEKYKKIFHL